MRREHAHPRITPPSWAGTAPGAWGLSGEWWLSPGGGRRHFSSDVCLCPLPRRARAWASQHLGRPGPRDSALSLPCLAPSPAAQVRLGGPLGSVTFCPPAPPSQLPELACLPLVARTRAGRRCPSWRCRPGALASFRALLSALWPEKADSARRLIALSEQEELWAPPLWLPFCGGPRGAGPLPLSLGPDRWLGLPWPCCRSGAPSQGSLRSQYPRAAGHATLGACCCALGRRWAAC